MVGSAPLTNYVSTRGIPTFIRIVTPNGLMDSSIHTFCFYLVEVWSGVQTVVQFLLLPRMLRSTGMSRTRYTVVHSQGQNVDCPSCTMPQAISVKMGTSFISRSYTVTTVIPQCLSCNVGAVNRTYKRSDIRSFPTSLGQGEC